MQDVGKISVYCHMSDSGLGECGGGGWTLVMKIDGSKVPYILEHGQSLFSLASSSVFACLCYFSVCLFVFGFSFDELRKGEQN